MRRTPEPRWVCVAALRGFSIVYVITVLNHRKNFANLLWCLTADDREFSKIAWKVKSDPSRWHLKVTLNFEHICTCPGTYNELSLITYANVKTEFFFSNFGFFSKPFVWMCTETYVAEVDDSLNSGPTGTGMSRWGISIITTSVSGRSTRPKVLNWGRTVDLSFLNILSLDRNTRDSPFGSCLKFDEWKYIITTVLFQRNYPMALTKMEGMHENF